MPAKPTDILVTIYTKTMNGGLWSRESTLKGLTGFFPEGSEITNLPTGYSVVCRETGDVAIHDIEVVFPSKKSIRDWHRSLGYTRGLNGIKRKRDSKLYTAVRLPDYTLEG